MPNKPLWQKQATPADWVTRFTVGDDYRWDTLLIPYDVEATRAHAWGLAQIDILTAEELESIDRVLDDLLGTDPIVRPEDEDSHTVIENYLTNRLGEVRSEERRVGKEWRSRRTEYRE